MHKRGSEVDWRMQEGEARSLARPIVRVVSRRFQIKGIAGDAVDAATVGESGTSYVTRVLMGGQPEEPLYAVGQTVDHREELRRAWQEAEARQRVVNEARERAAAQAQAERVAATESAAQQGEDAPILDFFAGHEEV
ncbi:MAG: hypothetical protein ACYDDZ_11065 [Acidimicrobiales bacterium]